MPDVAPLPSLIDDADFLAEIDKLETGPTPLDADALSVYWELASSVEEVGDGRIAARMPEAPAPEPQAQPTRSAKPVRPARIEKRVRTETPSSPRVGRVGDGRIDTPFQPEAPARHERPVHRERPVRPVHVDEIGQSEWTHATVQTAGSASLQKIVPASLVMLTVVLCYSAGAGSAALVFRDRVTQIAVLWGK